MGVIFADNYRAPDGVSSAARGAAAMGRRTVGREHRRGGVARASWSLLRVAALAGCIAVAALPGTSRAGTNPAPADKGPSKIGSKIAFAGDSIVDNYWSGMTRVIAADPHADEQRSPNHSGDPAHVVRTAGIVIYATFLLLILAIPQSLVNRLDDMNESAVQKILLRGASAVQAASHAAGLDRPYRRARSVFLALTGKEDE
jgi:hypothetical protein